MECLEELQPDLSDLTVTGDAQSDDFSQEAAQLGSSATIYQTEEQAKAAFDRVVDLIAGQKAIDCLVSGIQEGAEEEAGVQIEFGEASGSAVSFPEVAEQAETIVLEIPFAVEGQEFSGFFKFVFMREERALGGLFGFDLMTPIPADEQERLAQIVADRMAP